MKSTLFAIILSMFLNFAPIVDLNNQAGIFLNSFASHDILITLAPANNYIPKGNELDAAKVSIENHLFNMYLNHYNVTSDKKTNIITIRISSKSMDSTQEEITSVLCKRVEVKFLDPEGNIILEGKHINKCIAHMDTQILGSYVVSLEFNEEGKKRFADATARLIGQEISIYLDGMVISSPVVEEAIPNGEAVINRIDTHKEAMALASKIALGTLPYDLVPVDQNGNDSP